MQWPKHKTECPERVDLKGDIAIGFMPKTMIFDLASIGHWDRPGVCCVGVGLGSVSDTAEL